MPRRINIILLIVVLGINIFFRLGSQFLFFAKDTAEKEVRAELISRAKKAVDESFPDLPSSAKLKALDSLVDSLEVKEKNKIRQNVAIKEKEIKSNWQDASGQSYLLEIDPYHWLRLVNDLATKGKIGDKVVNGSRFDSFMLAPMGMKAEVSMHKSFHVYMGHVFFRIARLIKGDVPLSKVLFYVPIIISSMALIVVYCFCSFLSKNKINLSGFFAAITLGLSPIFLQRTMGGFFDTDAYVILFSALATWIFYLSLSIGLSVFKRLLLSVLGGMIIGLFSLTWDGWWYIFDMIFITTILYLISIYFDGNLKEKNRLPDLNTPLSSLLIFVFSSVVFVVIFSGWDTVKHLLTGPAGIIHIEDTLKGKFWPNVFLTVGELKRVNIITISKNMGGELVLLFGFLYLAAVNLFKNRISEYDRDKFISFFFVICAAILLYVSMRAVRFSLLITIPVSIYFGLFMEWLILYLSNKVKRFKMIRKGKEVSIVLFCVAFPLIFINKSLPQLNSRPLIDNSWMDFLGDIKEKTPKDAIINSWWDYGHWFKAIAQRRVIFDGITQNTPQAYWMARVFLTNNEFEAVGILRMLNSGGNQAFEELEKLGFDKYKCMDILKSIIILKRSEAATELGKYIPGPQERQRVLQFTHNPAPAYFIVEPSLIPKITSISFIGDWDFKKARITQLFNKLKKNEFMQAITRDYQYPRKEAQRLFDTLALMDPNETLGWIASGRQYYREMSLSNRKDDLLFFNGNFMVNIKELSVFFNDAVNGRWLIPKSIFYMDGEQLKEKNFEGSTMKTSVLLAKDGEAYSLIWLDSELGASMLTRLYYLHGTGLKYFTQVFSKQELKGSKGDIIVYKINWDKMD